MSFKNFAALAAIILTIGNLSAQAKKDTVVLSVYNTDKKYLLTQASFSPKVAKAGLFGDLVMAYDTVHTYTTVATKPNAAIVGLPTHIGTKTTKEKTENQLKVVHTGKFKAYHVKGKVAIVNYNPKYDATFICLTLQRAGAIAVILSHASNNKDSILVKDGEYEDSIKIPCYSVRYQRGFEISSYLPSLVGIKKNDTLGIVLALQQLPTVNQDSINKANKNKDTALFSIYPNPTDDDAFVQYAFTAPTDLNISITNGAGQKLHQIKLLQSTIGTYTIPSDTWANGIYYIELRYGKFSRTEKIFIER